MGHEIKMWNMHTHCDPAILLGGRLAIEILAHLHYEICTRNIYSSTVCHNQKTNKQTEECNCPSTVEMNE